MVTILRTPFQKAAFLAALAAFVFLVPYVVPVSPSVSLSYVVGFSNKTAVVLFVLGAIGFAVLSRGELSATTDHQNKSLSSTHLIVSVTIALALCLIKTYPGGEAFYNLNRLQLLMSGMRPFRDFEYPYGPLQLYAPAAFVKLFHVSVVGASHALWVGEWVLGTGMLWTVFRLLEMPMQRRPYVFWGALLWQFLSAIKGDGIQYTPVRMIGSAFFLIAVHAVWQRSRRPYLVVGLALMAVVFELGISPEQAVGVCAGVVGWTMLLATRKQRLFPLPAAILLLAGCALLFELALHFGLFISMFDFASGAYSVPLLPTPAVLLLLFVYVSAACVAVRRLRERNFESMAIPMVAGGFAMLPAAMGRCDAGHLQIAAAAFLLGVGWIESMPAVRRWWSPLILFRLFFPALRDRVFPKLVRYSKTYLTGVSERRPSLMPPAEEAAVSVIESSPLFAQLHLPCATVYRTPGVIHHYVQTPGSLCFDTGYYAGVVDILNSSDIARKISELDKPPRSPLLLFDAPLLEQMKAGEDDPSVLRGYLYPSALIPRRRHEPLSYRPIAAYIEQNYLPDPQPVGGFRSWRPKSVR